MKIKAKEKFSKLGSSNNWAGFGKTTYIKLESGKVVDCECSDHLLENGYVEEVKANNKKKESK